LQKNEDLVYDDLMPRKTLALIVGLVVVTVILFYIAVKTGEKQTPPPQPEAVVQPTKAVAHSVLSMSPNPVQVVPNQVGTVEVLLDPAGDQVTTVQLELSYDPAMLSNVKVVSGPLFTSPLVLINLNNQQTGRYTYVFGLQPNQKIVNAKGTVATITFTARGALGKKSEIKLLPSSLVAAQGIPTTVLKEGTGTTVVLGTTTVKGAAVTPVPSKVTTTKVAPVVTAAPIKAK